MGIWVCIGVIGGLVEDTMLYHDIMKAFKYIEGYLDDYGMSKEHFRKTKCEGLSISAKDYLFENDRGDPNYYQWIMKELKIEDAPRAALTSGSREQVLFDVNRLMEEGYYPFDYAMLAILTEDPISRPILTEHSVLMTTWKKANS